MSDVHVPDLAARTPREVLEDHLRLAAQPDGFEADLARNVAEDVVVLTGRGVFRGIPGVRELARQLMNEIPSGRWTYVTWLVEGRMGFLEWTVDEVPSASATAPTPTSSRTAGSARRPSTTRWRTSAGTC